jgi:hypothetical protein
MIISPEYIWFLRNKMPSIKIPESLLFVRGEGEVVSLIFRLLPSGLTQLPVCRTD